MHGLAAIFTNKETCSFIWGLYASKTRRRPNMVALSVSDIFYWQRAPSRWEAASFGSLLEVSLLVNIAAGLCMQFDILVLFLLRLCQFLRYWAEVLAPCLLWIPGPKSYKTKKSGQKFSTYKMIRGCTVRCKSNLCGLTTISVVY